MDDLIIIILTLVIAVVGTLGQIRKKRQPQEGVDGNEDNANKNFWNFIDEIIEQPLQTESNAEHEQVEPISEEKIEQQEYSFVTENEGKYSIKKEEPLKDEINENRRKERILENFSLKKAVIYSEILNRKYT